MKNKIDKKYLALFLTLSGVLLFNSLIQNLPAVGNVISKIFKVLSPVVYGFVIAYLLYPIMRWIKNLIIKIFKKQSETKAIRIISLILTYIISLIVLALIITLITTQVAASIDVLIDNSSNYIQGFSKWLESILNSISRFTDDKPVISSQIKNIAEAFKKLIASITDSIVNIVPGAFSLVDRLATVIGSIMIGFVLSVYMLIDKENLVGRIKKMTFALCGENYGNKLLGFGRDLDDTVGGFITGKLLGSLIAGVLSYFAFLICRIEFPALLAVIIGICDIIPEFGPIIGAIPCGILLLVVAPRQVIPFIIALIIIEQIEGNIISPNILSHTTGISGFWVIVALTIGGGFFGIVGMVLAVPFFAVLYKMFTKLINYLLDKKQLSSDTEYYINMLPDKKSGNNEKPKIAKLFQKKQKKDKSVNK